MGVWDVQPSQNSRLYSILYMLCARREYGDIQIQNKEFKEGK